MQKKINVAIDGYSSCGKSTLAKALAKKVGYTYIDSGAMYRAITLCFIQNNIDINNKHEVIEALKHINIEFFTTNDTYTILLNNTDVSKEIRELQVANLVSPVAAIKEVRAFAVYLQQQMGRNGGIVMDGRDIGTVVFPNAEFKIFMTASEDVRVKRRYDEMKATQPNITLEEVKQNIHQRDFIDTTRAIDPLTQAKDALLLDNSNMTREEQLQWAQEIFNKKTLNN
jgi:cytidylate kinase